MWYIATISFIVLVLSIYLFVKECNDNDINIIVSNLLEEIE